MSKKALIGSFFFCLTGCFSIYDSDENCIVEQKINDSLAIDKVKFYAGSDRRNPILFKITDGDCATIEYIVSPQLENKEGFEYDIFTVKDNRIAVQYFQRSEGVNSSIAFMISADKGESWETHYVRDIDSTAEGIWELELSGKMEITLKLFDLDKPNTYQSKDNGRTWNPIN